MFHNIEIEACPAFGWVGGPTASVRIKQLKNRHERRNRTGDLMQHIYTLPFQAVTDPEYLEHIKSVYMVVGGPADSFLCKDQWDYLVTDSPFGLGDGSTVSFQLSKRYYAGSGFYDRLITKPVSVVTAEPSTFDPLTGIVTFDDAPEDGALLTWSGEFRVPVRFSDFQLVPSIDARFSSGEFAMSGSCSLIEVFGE